MHTEEKKKILICEDDIAILEVCDIILTAKGYEVERCTKFTDILKVVKKSKPHFILMDLWIPENGGEEATRKLKDSKKYNHIPVVLFSANNDIETIAKRCHANGYLQKPFDVKYLADIVKEHVS